MLSSLSRSRMVPLAVVASLISSHLAMAAGPSAEQVEQLEQVVAKEVQTLDGLSNRRIITEYENLSALIYGENNRGLLRIDKNSSKEHKDSVASIAVRYAALKKKVEAIPGAKQAVYVKLFGDRQHSPYYGAVTEDEFKDEHLLFFYGLTGSPIFLILYILSNMDND